MENLITIKVFCNTLKIIVDIIYTNIIYIMCDRSLNNILTVVFRLTHDDHSIIQNMKNEFL